MGISQQVLFLEIDLAMECLLLIANNVSQETENIFILFLRYVRMI